MKRKIALFRNIEHDFESISEPSLERADSYIRITEYQEVVFIERDPRETVETEVKVLREKQKDIRAKAEVLCVEIDERISKLMALEHIPA